ncbi:centromere protein U [Hoplias malabaricus]|uniref:centromere protein U n=1 Tax=Hoplias malabaricus TaxID=27720 RepID=UPI00346252E9
MDKMSRMAEMLVRKRNQNADEDLGHTPESLNVSSIEKASFLQEEHYSSHGNPLHSTALEDEGSPELDSAPKATGKRKKGADREKGTLKRPDPFEKVHAKTKQKNNVQAQQKSTKLKKNQRAVQKTQPGPQSTRNLQNLSENREDGKQRRAQSKISQPPMSDDFDASTHESPDAGPSQTPRRPSLSSEDLTDEDESFHPSRVKGSTLSDRRHRGQKQKRKSSSGSSDTGNLKKRECGPVRNPIDLDIVLEAFQEFITQYKETVNSDSVIKAIDALSKSFEEQLNDMITATKGFYSVKREAAKINSALNKKTTRLWEAKNELFVSEAKVRKLEKEHDQLEQRLNALRTSNTFLTNLKDLNQRYLEYRIAHPDEPETFGPSCMPALLLEARSIMGTETQLKTINDKLQKVLEENGHK